ncbi:MAG: ABC transporter permease [Cytophagales bacterium]|nr:ABC transporter permease [Cytophagales bacterium]
MLYLKLAWRNIWRNRKRTWITASSIGFAVFFAVFMQSMQLGSYQRMIDNSVRFYTGHLAIHQAAYWEEKLLDNGFEQSKVESLILDSETIDVAVPRLTSFALASYKDKTKGALINGVDPILEARLTYLDNKLTAGSYMSGNGVLVAKGLAEYLKISVGDTLIFVSQGYHGVNAAGKYPVEGILKFPVPELNQSAVYLPLPLAQEFFGAEGIITSYSLLMNEPDEITEVQSSLAGFAKENDLEVMNWEEMMPELLQGIEMDYYGGLIMIYILYAVIGFGILGTFLMMTKERTYEFGILVSIGMKKLKIQFMVALEILMLTFFGVLLGLVASFPLTFYFFNNPIEFTGDAAKAYENFGYEAIIPFSLDPVIFYSQGVVILIISLFLGIYPMLAIQHLKIIKALKE